MGPVVELDVWHSLPKETLSSPEWSDVKNHVLALSWVLVEVCSFWREQEKLSPHK
jgi:hypothetical protein